MPNRPQIDREHLYTHAKPLGTTALKKNHSSSPDKPFPDLPTMPMEPSVSDTKNRTHNIDARPTASLKPLISLRNAGICYRPHRTILSKTKKEIWALRGLNLDIFEGEKLGIIGRNGCGKSTLMRLLTGIYSADEGTVTYHRKDCHIELLSLGVGFEGNLSGAENAVLNGMLMGKSRKHMLSRLDAIRDFSGLNEFFDMPVYTYSSGMGLRLGFSVAMETDPDVLLIDEVLGVGDEVFIKKSEAALTEKFKGNRTVVLISHDAATIARMCTRAVWLERGQILAEGSAKTVGEKYLTDVYSYTH